MTNTSEPAQLESPLKGSCMIDPSQNMLEAKLSPRVLEDMARVNDPVPPDPSVTSDEADGTQYFYSLQSALASHHVELQNFIQDWSFRQTQIFHKNLHEAVHSNLSPDFKVENGNVTEKAYADNDGGDASMSTGVGRAKMDSRETSSTARRVLGSSDTATSELTFASEVEEVLKQENGALDKRSSKSRHSDFRKSFRRNALGFYYDHGTSMAYVIPKRLRGFTKWRDANLKELEMFLLETETHSLLVRLVNSNGFAALSSLVILANAVFVGYASDYAINNLDDQATPLITVFECAFTSFYTVELVLRMTALGKWFLVCPDWKWNLFDIAIVASALTELLIKAVQQLDEHLSTSALRVARLPKMFRLVRAFRIMRMLRQLRLILSSILGSMQAMFWSVTLITLITYACGIVLLHAGIDTLKAGVSQAVNDDIIKFWGSILGSMLTLYMCTTGGIEWKIVAATVKPLGWAYYLIFLFYITFFLFVVVNTLTSVFVGSAMRRYERDQQNIICEEMKKKADHVKAIKDMFHTIARDDHAILHQSDFEVVLQNPDMMAFMSSLEIEPMDVEQFFSILSNDGRDGVDIETFVIGCMRMAGHARSMDLLGSIHRDKAESARLQRVEHELKEIKILLCTPRDLNSRTSQVLMDRQSASRSAPLKRKAAKSFQSV